MALSIALAALAPAACGGGSSEGALGQAHVSSDCPSSDLSCLAKGVDGPIAVGATVVLDVSLQFQGAAPPPTRLLSSHPDILSVDGETARGAGAGNATLLIMLAGEDTVIDFLHVWVAEPDRLTLHLMSKDGRDLGEPLPGAQLLAGDDLILSARVFARGQLLAGAAPGIWTTDSEAVALLREPIFNQTRLVARKPGSATVTIQVGALSASLPLEVLP